MSKHHSISKNIVLAGNPNSGKTTLFNRLTGSRQKIANYPGVTVEKIFGVLKTPSGGELTIIDLPGTYSLNTKSEDEAIAARHIQGDAQIKQPDIAVVVVEAAKLNRGLLLFSQVQKIHPHVILVLNMIDEFEKQGMRLDLQKLTTKLCVPVVLMSAKSGQGVDQLIAEIEKLDGLEKKDISTTPRSQVCCGAIGEEYKRIDALVKEVLTKPKQKRRELTDKLDKVILHPVFGPFILFAVMFLLFQALFSWAAPLMDWIDQLFSSLGDSVKLAITIPWLSSLISDGIIAGVGSVLVFIPQIMIAFILIGLLEMTGYLARGAFIIDRLMRLIGLEGRAFIPLISSFACAIPGILSTRTMPNPRQRLITTLIAPLMTCSARLPVYILLIACFVPQTKIFGFVGMQGLTLFGLFLVGILGAMLMSLLFNKFLPKQCGLSSFFMELPRYRWPSFKNIYTYVSFRTTTFLKTAGTIIFVLSVVLWFMAYFPRSEMVIKTYEVKKQMVMQTDFDRFTRDEKVTELEQEESGELLRNSFMGKLGVWMEPALRPMGFDWKLGIGVIASFAAREVFVSTMGIVFNIGEVNETSESLRSKLHEATTETGKRAYTLRTAFSLMVFFVFAAQCMSTLAVIRRETGSTKWAVFVFVYLTTLAYVMSTITYQGLGLIGMA